MPKIQQIQDLTRVQDPATFMKYASQLHNETTNTINGKLEFDSNLATHTTQVTFPKANTTVAVTHPLNKTSVNYMIANSSQPAHIFNGEKTNTKNTVYLQASAPGTFTLVLS